MHLTSTDTAIFWFRRDLRLHDNAGLFHALTNYKKVIPLFIFDTDILDKLENKADKRVDLIQQILADMNRTLHLLGSGLLIKTGKVSEVFHGLLHEFAFDCVVTNRDYESEAIARDSGVENLLKKKGINFTSCKDQVIFETNEILKPDGKPYTVFTPYSRKWKATLTDKVLQLFKSEDLLHKLAKSINSEIPSLKSIGFATTGIIFEKPAINLKIITDYSLHRDFPGIAGTSKLGLHLRFGTVSIRELVKTALNSNETWLNELIWREFFMQILFHFPHVVTRAFKPKYDEINWRNEETEFERWRNGLTGFPIVDAGMRELNETGWMHNRVRMICASFLTKHLLIDWRWGEAYFASKLLDYDLASNNGNWQWASGSGCDAAPYFRIFNPTEQTRKFDPDLIYINRWIPELNSLSYPSPMVEHAIARDRALTVYKKGLSV